MDAKAILATLKKNAMLVVLVVVFLFFTILTNGSIFSPSSFSELINQNAYVFILGAGMLMCMLTGGNIDLSCGAFVCLLGVFGGLFMVSWGLSTGISLLLLILVGVAYGCILGYIIAYVKIPPWIATLVGYLAFRGLGTQMLSDYFSPTASIAASQFPSSFTSLFYGWIFPTAEGEFNIVCFVTGLVAAALTVFVIFNTRRKRLAKGYEADTVKKAVTKSCIGAAAIILVMTQLSFYKGIPTVLLWVVGIVLIYSFITSKTTIGRHFYVVGGNMEAARLSGVNTKRIMFLAYLNMAVLTSIATMTVVSRVSVIGDSGKRFEMDAISACVVGGVSASGGAGTVLGMVIGATLIGVINMGMSLISLNADFQQVVKGFVLLGAVVFDILSQKKSK